MSEVAVHLVDVQKSFGEGEIRTQVLFDITQDICTGELTLLVGPSGCGKTTLISIIGGILEADCGEINVFGSKVNLMSDDLKTEFRKNNIGYIFQQHNLIPTLTVLENVSIPLIIQGYSTEEAERLSLEMLETVEIISHAYYYPRDLSGGQQQRVAIARSLITKPRLVICDEPTASLDGKSGRRIVGMLKDIALQQDKCVIVVTHDTRIFKFGDRMIKIEDGRIITDKPIIRRDI
ncbi:MAG: ABC transporter ATP-binding protein [Cyanobacteriota bacterium]